MWKKPSTILLFLDKGFASKQTNKIIFYYAIRYYTRWEKSPSKLLGK